jgi:hypothetical protein
MAKRIVIKKIHVILRTNYLSAMKKRIYLLLLSVIVIFSSCKDKTNLFAEQLFTNEQISTALRDCISITSDSTLNTLCVVDTLGEDFGFNYYDLGAYRIEFPASAREMIDTLVAYGYKEQIDSLIFIINRAAEMCGNNLKNQFLAPLAKNITFTNPGTVLRGGNTAIADYVKTTKHTEFVSSLVSYSLVEQFGKLQIMAKWNALQEKYYELTEHYSSVDILNHGAQQFVSQFFKKMALVEVDVRKNPGAYSNTNGLLYRVFSTL